VAFSPSGLPSFDVTLELWPSFARHRRPPTIDRRTVEAFDICGWQSCVRAATVGEGPTPCFEALPRRHPETTLHRVDVSLARHHRRRSRPPRDRLCHLAVALPRGGAFVDHEYSRRDHDNHERAARDDNDCSGAEARAWRQRGRRARPPGASELSRVLAGRPGTAPSGTALSRPSMPFRRPRASFAMGSPVPSPKVYSPRGCSRTREACPSTWSRWTSKTTW
jgi:hypothetical protein